MATKDQKRQKGVDTITKATLTDEPQPTKGSELLAGKDSARAIADALGVSKTLAGYWVSGRRRPTKRHMPRLLELYGIPAEAWKRPIKTSETAPPAVPTTRKRAVTLPPWLARLCREGLDWIPADERDDELERTAHVIAGTLEKHPEIGRDVIAPLARHPSAIADMLAALRPWVKP